MTLKTENSRVEVGIITVFFLLLSLLFYLEDRDLTAIELSSDQWNFVPITMKMTDQNLFQTDLFMADMRDVEYYTPWFIKPLYFFSWLNGGDPMQGLNSFHLVVQLLYCLCWFMLLRSLIGNIWLVAIFTLLARGVMWPPGNELWGIAGAWTLLPRTVYTALLPIPVLLLLKSVGNGQQKRGYFLAAFLLGLIGNVHAISGLICGSALLLSFGLHAAFYGTKKLTDNLRLLVLATLLFILGLLPFIITYMSDVVSKTVSNPELFSQLLPIRIGSQFLSPFGVFEKLLEPKWILLLLTPVVISAFCGKYLAQNLRAISRWLTLLFLSILGICLLIVPLEGALNQLLGLQLKVAFQLVRGIKYLILPALLLYGIWANQLFVFLFKRMDSRPARLVSSGIFVLFVTVLFVSRSFAMNVPVLSDDLIRGQLPDNMTRYPYDEPEDEGLLEALNWIEENTSPQALFAGPSLLRVGARRSVVHDFKGGSMLIEGNPDKYITWALRQKSLKELKTLQQKADTYVEWGANYLLVKDDSGIAFPLIRQFGKWQLYKLSSND